jgi:hypothetical protein
MSTLACADCGRELTFYPAALAPDCRYYAADGTPRYCCARCGGTSFQIINEVEIPSHRRCVAAISYPTGSCGEYLPAVDGVATTSDTAT